MICAVVLAAGQSRRMGVQKLLLPIHGQPLIARVVDQVLSGPAERVFVVVGADAAAIAAALAERPVRFVYNPAAEGAMLSSVRCGLQALPPECAAVLVVLGDQPDIGAAVMAQLVEAFRAGRGGIVVPVHRGRRGHPLLFAMRYRDEILRTYDDSGLRGLLQAHPDDLYEAAVDRPGVLEDLDVPEDYQRAEKQGTFRFP
jgi:molybdenum cofactor cytidylyltransferase